MVHAERLIAQVYLDLSRSCAGTQRHRSLLILSGRRFLALRSCASTGLGLPVELAVYEILLLFALAYVCLCLLLHLLLRSMIVLLDLDCAHLLLHHLRLVRNVSI